MYETLATTMFTCCKTVPAKLSLELFGYCRRLACKPLLHQMLENDQYVASQSKLVAMGLYLFFCDTTVVLPVLDWYDFCNHNECASNTLSIFHEMQSFIINDVNN